MIFFFLHEKQVFTAAVTGSIRESQLKGEEGQEDLKESHRTAVTEVCDVIEKNILKVKKS